MAITIETLASIHHVNFHGNIIKTIVADDHPTINKWIAYIDSYRQHAPNNFIVGLNINWRPSRPPTIIQLCVGFHCIIIKLISNRNHQPLPQSLVKFLESEHYDFVGCSIERDMQSLLNHYGIRIKNGLNLGSYAVGRYNLECLNNAGLSVLARIVMKIEIDQTPRNDNWDAVWLTEEQIKYASGDAFATFEIGRLLLTPSSQI